MRAAVCHLNLTGYVVMRLKVARIVLIVQMDYV